MRLHENQLRLIRHLVRFNLLDYASCLHLLDTEETGDQAALEEEVQNRSKNGTGLHNPAQGDYEKWPYRFFVNPASNLLKYVYFFSAAKELIKLF